MLDLKDFVKEAVLAIVAGINDAQKELNDTQRVGSSGQHKMMSLPSSVSQDHNGNLYSIVNFDIAVTTVDEVTGGGGIKVFSIGAQGEMKGRAETASRIQFATTVRMV